MKALGEGVIETTFQDLHEGIPRNLKGKEFQFCTVRQPTVRGLSMGTLYWLLQARRVLDSGSSVAVTDFYDDKKSDGSAVIKLAEALQIPKGRNRIKPAEDVQRNMYAWRLFCDYIRAHRDEGSTWGVIGTMDEGIDAVLASEGYDVPASMERFLEELSVWSLGIDDTRAVQVFHHEDETTEWTMRLFPNASKNFLKVALPMANEFRGKYKVALEGGGEATVQRRVGDLAAKLAEPNDVNKGEGEGAELKLFYKILFNELVEALKSRDAPDDHKSVVAKLMQIDPDLVAFYIESLGAAEIKKYMRASAFYEYRRGSGDDYHRNIGEDAFAEVLFKGILLIARSEAQVDTPALERIKTILAAMPCSAYLNPVPSTHASPKIPFDNLMGSEALPINEVVENIWLPVAESDDCHFPLIHDHFWANPISDRIAREVGTSSKLWEKVFSKCMSILDVYPITLIRGKMSDIPLFKKVVDYIVGNNPEILLSIARRNLEQTYSDSRLLSTESIRMYVYMLERYVACPGVAEVETARGILERAIEKS